MNREDILVCNADKGGGVVILDVEDYMKEAMRHLNIKHYKELKSDPTMLHFELISSTIENLKK